jgi:biotin carboxyl carrier protein
VGDDPLLTALRAVLPELERSAVVELDVAVGDARITLRRRPGQAPVVLTQGAAADGAPEADEDLVEITTPLSGVFYATPAPEEPPYVSEGDEVEAGQIVGLVEAMKVFNEIHAEAPGTIVRVNVTQGALVQSGQALMLLRPSAQPLVTGEAV